LGRAIADSAVVRTQPCQNKKAFTVMMNALFENDGGQGWIGD
jgi:hypothetical protein